MLVNVSFDPQDLDKAAASVLAAWRDALVVRIRPTRALPDVHRVYDQLLPRIGTPLALAEDIRAGDRDNQRTGEIWFEVRYDPSFKDAYRYSPNAQPLHTDGSYIAASPNATLMCCVSAAGEGGETTFIKAEDVISALEAEDPELLQELRAREVPHARSGDRRVLPVLRREAGEERVNWNYYCVDTAVPPEVKALRERFFQFLEASPRIRNAIVAVKLEPGDAIVWKDERLLHGRNSFVAHATSERFLWKCSINVGVFEAA